MPGFLADVLTWPKNYHYAVAVQTAVGMGLPPTLFIDENRHEGAEWSRADKKLAMAWTILQKETCQQCGNPLWICRSSQREMQFKVNTDICYATAELKKWEKGQKAKHLKDGEYPFIIPYMSDDSTLPSRKAYLVEKTDE